jgi:hypothetical protein
MCTVDEALQALLPLALLCSSLTRMGLRKLSERKEVSETDDLPWIDAYVRETGDKDAISTIKSVYVCETGLLVICGGYKAFLHEGSEDYANLVEALPLYVQASKPLPLLVCTANRKKKPEVCVDDEKLSYRWYKTERKYVQVLGKGEYDPNKKKQENPLLLGLTQAADNHAEGSPQTAGACVDGEGVKGGKAKKRLSEGQ